MGPFRDEGIAMRAGEALMNGLIFLGPAVLAVCLGLGLTNPWLGTTVLVLAVTYLLARLLSNRITRRPRAANRH